MLFVSGRPHDADVVIPSRSSVDLEIFCMVQKTLTRGSGVFTADICLVDDRGDVWTIKKVKFNYLKQSNAAETPSKCRIDQRRSPLVKSAWAPPARDGACSAAIGTAALLTGVLKFKELKMKLAFFDDYKLGVVVGDQIVDVSSVARGIKALGPQDVIRTVIEKWSAYTC